MPIDDDRLIGDRDSLSAVRIIFKYRFEQVIFTISNGRCRYMYN
jgi:hypothetical protein